MKKLICFFILFLPLITLSQPFGMKPGDSAKFIGVPRTPGDSVGMIKIWCDSKGITHYNETWKDGNDLVSWSGKFIIKGNVSPQVLLTQFAKNGKPDYIETADSLTYVHDETTDPVKKSSRNFHIPWGGTATLHALYVQYALSTKKNEFPTDNMGMIRVRKVGSTTLKMDTRKINLSLYILSSDSATDMEHVWLDDKMRLFAIALAQGLFDLLPYDWQASRNELLQAEFLASQANKNITSCAGGFGFGSCENSNYLCRLTTRGKFANSITLSDSGYSVRSDGLGPYINGSPGIQGGVGPIGGMTLGRGGVKYRYFSIDLTHPVPGDIGVSLGLIKADGWPGIFYPSGANFMVEIAAQWYTEKDFTQHSIMDIPLGKTVDAEQLDFDFYIDGVHYVMQMGPLPVGHCFSDGTAIYGDGTTKGTITRETNTKWIVDLPPGSIGRLFDDHIDDKSAINKGLYYVSLHYEIETKK